MLNIPTAEELLEEHFISVDKSNIKHGHYFVIKEAMKEFAKLHVEAALKEVNNVCDNEIEKDFFNEQLILNAYPLTLIK